MRNINNRQKLRVSPPRNAIARMLPKFKPQTVRSREVHAQGPPPGPYSELAETRNAL